MRSRVGAGAGSARVQRADAPPEAPPRFRARCRRWSGPGRGPGRGFRARPPRPRPRRPPALDCSCLAAAAWRRGRPRRWRPWWRSAQPSTLRSCCASEPSERGRRAAGLRGRARGAASRAAAGGPAPSRPALGPGGAADWRGPRPPSPAPRPRQRNGRERAELGLPARPRPAARPGGLRGRGRRGDSAPRPGGGGARTPPARPRPGPGSLCPPPLALEGPAAGAAVPGGSAAFGAPRSGRCSGCAAHRPTREAFRGREPAAAVRSGLGRVPPAVGPPRNADRGRARRQCGERVQAGVPGRLRTWRPAGPGALRGPGGSPRGCPSPASS